MKDEAATECQKMIDVSEKSQAIGEFLEWAQNQKGMVVAEYTSRDAWDNELLNPRLIPAQFQIETLLAEFFDIDLGKVEQERREMLSRLREE